MILVGGVEVRRTKKKMTKGKSTNKHRLQRLVGATHNVPHRAGSAITAKQSRTINSTSASPARLSLGVCTAHSQHNTGITSKMASTNEVLSLLVSLQTANFAVVHGTCPRWWHSTSSSTDLPQTRAATSTYAAICGETHARIPLETSTAYWAAEIFKKK